MADPAVTPYDLSVTTPECLTMKVVIIIFAVFFIAIGAVLAFAATKPDVFQVRRTVVVKAAPEKVFPLINDFKSWTAWSPYEKKDPAMKRTYGLSLIHI